jgi:hypothetical protein
MEAARLHKLIGKLDTSNVHEQHAALAAIDRRMFTDIAMALDAITDAERRTGYPFEELVGIIKKRWPKPEEGWRGLSDVKKFAFHRALVNQKWLSDDERHKLIEMNDRLCVAPGNPADAGDCEFMDQLLRRAKREGVRI